MNFSAAFCLVKLKQFVGIIFCRFVVDWMQFEKSVNQSGGCVVEGAEFDIHLFGVYAMNALRMEKAYRGFAGELTNEITMIEADMERFVGWDKDDFIGKRATLSSKQTGPRISLVYLEVDAVDADCLGGEPVYTDDKLVGVTTSGGYGFAVQKSLAFAYVEPDLAAPGAAFNIDILGTKRQARAIAQPIYDPKNERLRV